MHHLQDLARSRKRRVDDMFELRIPPHRPSVDDGLVVDP